jgi:hypothetical protein
MDVMELSLGITFSSQLNQGSKHYYKFIAPEAEDILITLECSSEDAVTEMYARYDSLPDLAHYDYLYSDPLQASHTINISNTQAGTYYIFVLGNHIPSDATDYTISAEILPFTIRSFEPIKGGNTGKVTIEIPGARFDSETSAFLSPEEGSTIEAISIYLIDSTLIYATFDLAGSSIGFYELMLQKDDGSEAVATQSFEVEEGFPPNLSARIVGPSTLRRGMLIPLWIEYMNIGNIDMEAPLLTITSTTGNLMGFSPINIDSNSIDLLGKSASGPPGILRPGIPQSIPLFSRTGRTDSHFMLSAAPPSDDEIDYDELENRLYPDHYGDEEWDEFWSEFKNVMGPTWADWLKRTSNDLNNTSLPLPTKSYSELILFEMLNTKINVHPPDFLIEQSLPDPIECKHYEDPKGKCGWATICKRKESTNDNWNIISHGWNASPNSEGIKNIINTTSAADNDSGIITVNWSDGSNCRLRIGPCDPWRASQCIDHAAEAAKEALKDWEIDGDQANCIGHSFGCYVCARTSCKVGKVRKVVGLDCASDLGLWPRKPDILRNCADCSRSYYANTIADYRNLPIANNNFLVTGGDSGDKCNPLLNLINNLILAGKRHGYGLDYYAMCSHRALINDCSSEYWESSVKLGNCEPHKMTGQDRQNLLKDSGICEDDLLSELLKFLADLWYLMKVHEILIDTIVPVDPNAKVSTKGYGEAGFVSPEEPIPYIIQFENVSSATAAAQKVQIEDYIDLDVFDIRTFRLGSFSFGDINVEIPQNRAYYHSRIPIDEETDVEVDAGINISTGRVHWKFATIDLATGEPTDDPLQGFLPPNDETHRGEGYVSFTIRPKDDLLSMTEIRNQATITFDINEPMDTNETFNTLDAEVPNSLVAELPPETRELEFEVSWSGEDDSGGSGLAGFTIFVSDNGSPYKPWLTFTSHTHETYIGEYGHVYSFYSIARDNVGNIEDKAPIAEATISINHKPIAEAGEPQTPECSENGTAFATLNGSGSYDPDNDPITYFWSAPGIEFEDPTSVTPSASFP